MVQPGMTYHAPMISDCTNRPGSSNARGDVDASEVEVDSDGEVDARDDLDALVDVRDCSVRLMRMMLVEAGQRVAEWILARRGSDQALLLREADRGPRPMP